MVAMPLDLTSRNDHGLSLAVLAGMAPLEWFALWGPDACGGLPAAIDRLHSVQRTVEAARRIDDGYRDHLRRMLILLEDHAWAVSQVLERHSGAVPGLATTPMTLTRTAEGFAHLSAAAGRLLADIEALEAM